MPWGSQIDSFSIGCTIAQLYLEHPVTLWSSSPEERLASIEKAIGHWGYAYAMEIEEMRPNTFSIIAKSKVRVKFRPEGDDNAHTCLTDAAKRRVDKTHNIKVRILTSFTMVAFLTPRKTLISSSILRDLVLRLTHLDPAFRMLPKDALGHHYFETTITR